jgi:hypothetical protein
MLKIQGVGMRLEFLLGSRAGMACVIAILEIQPLYIAAFAKFEVL